MKYIFRILSILFFLSCTSPGKNQDTKTRDIKNQSQKTASASPLNSCTYDENTFRCVKYIKNHDGDTITFHIPRVHPLIGKNIKVRLKGINTAEINGTAPCEKEKALKAKNLVAQKLQSAKTIHLLNIRRGTFFRIIADVIIDGQSLSKVLLEEKLALPYRKKSKGKINWCTMSYFL